MYYLYIDEHVHVNHENMWCRMGRNSVISVIPKCLFTHYDVTGAGAQGCQPDGQDGRGGYRVDGQALPDGPVSAAQ